jgi:uncharacterized protein DUF3825
MADAGREVEFDLEAVDQTRSAKKIQFLGVTVPTASAPTSKEDVWQDTRVINNPSPGEALKAWAYVPFVPFKHRGTQYSSVLEYLAQIVLPERWHFGGTPNARNPFPILDNYLTYTFFRLQREGQVLEKKTSEGSWAVFNTGLVDKLYDPIFALFTGNKYETPPWRFYDFCVPGKGDSGRRLTSVFDPLPKHARYFDNSFELVLDTSREIHVDYEHVILDGVSRGRFPYAFLEQHTPKGFKWLKYVDMEAEPRMQFLGELSAAIERDVQCTRVIKRRLEDAKLLAEKRTRWNFKTAIPNYYPRFNTMSLLLPLALVDDEVVDIALVVTKNPSGSYQGRTVLPLGWAYQNARLVCRPDSDWLVPDRIKDFDTVGELQDDDAEGSTGTSSA